MDILDILLDILLKPPQPFIGLFLTFTFEIPERHNLANFIANTLLSIIYKITLGVLSETIS